MTNKRLEMTGASRPIPNRRLAASFTALCLIGSVLAACQPSAVADNPPAVVVTEAAETDVTASAVIETSDLKARPPQDEIVYFMLPDRFENGDPSNDRGGFEGDALQHGFDPTQKGFYQGGDLKGLTNRLDYIQGMGATAIWLGPIYKNKPVQGGPGRCL